MLVTCVPFSQGCGNCGVASDSSASGSGDRWCSGTSCLEEAGPKPAMGLAAAFRENLPSPGKRWHQMVHHALRLGRRVVLLVLLLCSAPGLVVVIPMVAIACATPITVILLFHAHLPRLWNHVRPCMYREALTFEPDRLPSCMPVEPATPPARANSGKASEIVPWPDVSPVSPASGYLSAEDFPEFKGVWLSPDQIPAAPQLALLADHEENMTWGGRAWMQEASSGSTSPSYYSTSPARSPATVQDEALARKLRRDIVGLRNFVGDSSTSQGPLLKDIEDLGTFLGIDLPLTATPSSDLQRAKECLDLLKLVVGVQFR